MTCGMPMSDHVIRMQQVKTHHFMFGIFPASVSGGRTVSGSWRALSGFWGPRMSLPHVPLLGIGLRIPLSNYRARVY